MPKTLKITATRRAELDAALEASGGVFNTAAQILGCHGATVKKHVKADDILCRKWKPEWVKEDGEDPEIHRPVQLTAYDKEEIAMAKQDRSLQKGFVELGFAEDEIAFLTPLAEFSNGRLEQVIDLTYGGMVNNTAKLMILFNKQLEKVNSIMLNPDLFDETNAEGTIVYSGYKKLKESTTILLEIQKEVRATARAAEDTMITRAKIREIKKRQQEEDKDPLKKPGFGGPPEVFGTTPNLTQNVYSNQETKKADAEI